MSSEIPNRFTPSPSILSADETNNEMESSGESTPSSNANLGGHEVAVPAIENRGVFREFVPPRRSVSGDSPFTSLEHSLSPFSVAESSNEEDLANELLARLNQLDHQCRQVEQEKQEMEQKLDQANEALQRDPENPSLQEAVDNAAKEHQAIEQTLQELLDQLEHASIQAGDALSETVISPSSLFHERLVEPSSPPGAYMVNHRGDHEGPEMPLIFSGPAVEAEFFSEGENPLEMPESVAHLAPETEIITNLSAQPPGRSFLSRFRPLPRATPSPPEVTARRSPLPEAFARSLAQTPDPEKKEG